MVMNRLSVGLDRKYHMSWERLDENGTVDGDGTLTSPRGYVTMGFVWQAWRRIFLVGTLW